MADDDVSFLSFLRRKPSEKAEQLKQDDKAVHQEIKAEEQKLRELKTEDRKVETELKAAEQQAKHEEKLDLSGFLRFLKKPGSSGPADQGIDIKRVGRWFWDHRILFILLIPIILSITIRTASSNVPVADEYGTGQVLGFIREDIARTLQAQYPNLPQDNLARRVDEEFQRAIRQPTYTVKTGDIRGQTFNIGAQIAQTSAQFRSFFTYDANGMSYMYMPDIDPYTYLRWARNYLEKGDIADERRAGVPYDDHMVAPLGASIEATIHPYVLAWIYQVMSIFNGKITLMQAANYFPVIMMALSVIPVFFIGRRVGGTTAGFFAAIIFSINGALLGRTNWGHADTDAYNILFPLYIMWCYLESYYTRSWKWRLALLGAAGFLTGLFAFSWSGWWYIYDFIIVAGVVYAGFLIWAHRAELKQGVLALLASKEVLTHALLLLLFLFTSGIFVSAFTTFHGFWNAPLEPLDFIKIKDAAKITLFPNVLTTVAELNEASLEQVVGQMGVSHVGRIPFFFIAVIGLLLLVLPRDRFTWRDLGWFVAGLVWYWIFIGAVPRLQPLTVLILFTLPIAALMTREAFRGTPRFDVKLALLLTIWFIGTMYASTKGIRFVMMLVPAFSIAFGAGIGLLARALGSWGGRTINVSPRIIAGVVIAAFAFLLVAPAQSAYDSAKHDLPIINDAWYNTLTSIKESSKPTAIITSWWDFGHHFKYYSDRRVTFDGASQNEPMAHWVGKILLTDDEKLAIGLLRMLDCGSSKAFDTLDAEVQDASVTAKLIYEVVRLDGKQAERVLKQRNISPDTVEQFLAYTHCDPPEAFFIASGDMIGKSGVWSHFGSWDFDRADIWVFARNMPREDAIEFIAKNSNVSKDEAERLYLEVQAITDDREGNSWIAPWPSYNQDLFGCDRRNNTLLCGNEIAIDLETMDATMPSSSGRSHPAAFAYPTETGVVRRAYNSTVPFSLTLIPQGDRYAVLLAHKELAAGMFTRMYYHQGHGLRHFKPFNVQRDSSGLLIYTYQVDWTGNSTHAVPGMGIELVAPEDPATDDRSDSTITANSTAPGSDGDTTNAT